MDKKSWPITQDRIKTLAAIYELLRVVTSRKIVLKQHELPKIPYNTEILTLTLIPFEYT